MRYKKTGSFYIVRIDRGEEIVGTLKLFCTDKKIALGTVQGIGAADPVTIGLFETGTKTYHTTTLTGDHEISSLLGNITTKDGECYLHVHATLSDASYRVYGGHMSSAVVSGTCELFITVIDDHAGRTFDTGVGLNLLDF